MNEKYNINNHISNNLQKIKDIEYQELDRLEKINSNVKSE